MPAVTYLVNMVVAPLSKLMREQQFSATRVPQSRGNFAMWSQFVVPGNPLKSVLLLHPLATSAGGDHFHAGGKHWKSQSDPEWQTLADWVNGKTLGGSK